MTDQTPAATPAVDQRQHVWVPTPYDPFELRCADPDCYTCRILPGNPRYCPLTQADRTHPGHEHRYVYQRAGEKGPAVGQVYCDGWYARTNVLDAHAPALAATLAVTVGKGEPAAGFANVSTLADHPSQAAASSRRLLERLGSAADELRVEVRYQQPAVTLRDGLWVPSMLVEVTGTPTGVGTLAVHVASRGVAPVQVVAAVEPTVPAPAGENGGPAAAPPLRADFPLHHDWSLTDIDAIVSRAGARTATVTTTRVLIADPADLTNPVYDDLVAAFGFPAVRPARNSYIQPA